ncbi:MAG: glycerophosphodiester phosphodiesterase [Devosia sp.]|uniref:glycerophosphodiester phosphodiesterase family protein n=1 Tax=Devosia sp. TaxID=1871048 RepID=UPI001AC49CE4|nr:glycerophosphodiester phosphodiesterase family protein [Devosia sp.]MBN9314648.1 glycerophosphodiester phosphodiesterase [Devosia sp.]
MTDIIGHRGGRNLWPENSMLGFRRALELAIDAVEFDLHLTDAGEILVIHDATLDRTVEASGEVRALPAGAHASLRLRGSDEGIPTLDEVLSLMAASRRVELHVELKADATGTPYPGLAARAANAVASYGLGDRCLLTSFNLDVLEECRAVAPGVRRLVSINEKSAERLGLLATLQRANALVSVVAVHKDLLAAQWAEITATIPPDRICAWTVNEAAEIAAWLDRGVGYITSDDPVLALATRSARAGGAAA